MNKQAALKSKLIEAFGPQTYDENKQLDRKYLGNIVFNNQTKLDLLNSIVHPAVFEDGVNWQTQQAQKGVPYSLKEAALLFETGSYKTLDKIIVVTVPDDIRIERVMTRDNVSRVEVLARIDKQMLQSEKKAKADFILTNITIEELKKQIADLHHKILKIRP